MATGSISHGRAHSNDVAALLYATDEHGRVDPLAYESQRLILRNQTLGGIDAVRLVEDMVTSPAFKDRDEVKTSAQGLARNQYGDPEQFITKRLERAIEAKGHWAPKNTTEGLSQVADALGEEIQQQGGQVNAKWVRLNLSREPDSLELRIDKSVEPWQATPSRTRGAMPDEPQPDLAQAQGPFGDPYLDRYYAAVMSGNTDLADRIANEFTQSPEGQKMLQQGNELYAQQQLQKQQQLQEQMQAQVRQGPVLTR